MKTILFAGVAIILGIAVGYSAVSVWNSQVEEDFSPYRVDDVAGEFELQATAEQQRKATKKFPDKSRPK